MWLKKKPTQTAKKKRERNRPRETKMRRQWLQKNKTGRTAGGLARSSGGRGLKRPGRWGGGDEV